MRRILLVAEYVFCRKPTTLLGTFFKVIVLLTKVLINSVTLHVRADVVTDYVGVNYCFLLLEPSFYIHTNVSYSI